MFFSIQKPIKPYFLFPKNFRNFHQNIKKNVSKFFSFQNSNFEGRIILKEGGTVILVKWSDNSSKLKLPILKYSVVIALHIFLNILWKSTDRIYGSSITLIPEIIIPLDFFPDFFQVFSSKCFALKFFFCCSV